MSICGCKVWGCLKVKVTSEVLDMEYGMSECIRLMREELLRTILRFV